jgi:hypothetical protein
MRKAVHVKPMKAFDLLRILLAARCSACLTPRKQKNCGESDGRVAIRSSRESPLANPYHPADGTEFTRRLKIRCDEVKSGKRWMKGHSEYTVK